MISSQKGNSTVIAIVVLLLIGGGAFIALNNKKSQVTPSQQKVVVAPQAASDTAPVPTKTEEQPTNVAVPEVESTNEAMEKPTEEPIVTENQPTTPEPEAPSEPLSPGTYTSYSTDKVASAGQNKTVLFFHAAWCPTCRTLDKDINNSLNDIPAGIQILKTNYDTEKDLKKKYGVTYQHTFVQVDPNGNLIKTWGGGNKLENVLGQIQ